MALVFHADAKWESPYVFSTYVALVEKQVPFEIATLDLGRGDQRQPGFAGPSLTGKVPAIEHDGFWLTESLAIAEYLEEVFPTPPLFPSAPKDRARARQLMSWLRSDLMPLREERPTSSIFFAPIKTPLSVKAQAAADKLLRVAAAVIRPGADTLFPGHFCLVDADLAMMLHRLIANDDPVPEGIRTWAKGVWARPSVAAFVALER